MLLSSALLFSATLGISYPPPHPQFVEERGWKERQAYTIGIPPKNLRRHFVDQANLFRLASSFPIATTLCGRDASTSFLSEATSRLSTAALLTAFMLGRSGHKSMDWLEDMVKKVEDNDSALRAVVIADHQSQTK
jgi:hypothetical protein